MEEVTSYTILPSKRKEEKWRCFLFAVVVVVAVVLILIAYCVMQ